MIQGRKIAIAVFMAFAATGVVYGDMMPATRLDRPPVPPTSSASPAASESSDESTWSADRGMANLALPSFASCVELSVTTEQVDAAQPLGILPHDRGSVDLCLYALLGLGLCRSGQLARRSTLGFIPGWYHAGGPYQIGHSHAVGPETLCPIPLYCFIQPDAEVDDVLSSSRLGAFASLPEPAQYVPAGIISRGPPVS